MTIVVTTPTGRVGSRVTQLLIQAGVRPRLLVRDAAKVPAAVRTKADIVEVDLGDAPAVARACSGARALYWVDPPTDDDDPVAGYDRMGASAARAVVECGIERVVFQSSVGAEARRGFGEIDGLGKAEDRLDSTGAAVTHLRCGYFFTNLLMDLESLRNGVLATTLPLDQRISFVDPRDVGDVAVARLLSDGWAGRHTQGVLGPADLSFTEVAKILSAASGHEIVAQQVSDDVVAQQLATFGMTPAQVDGVVGMLRGFRGDFLPENPRDVISTTPTTLESWACSVLRPALRAVDG
ncbi:NmrA family NAD(P)-binding protein [Williamsia muralis]|uniref:NAD(P)H-binding protein n=1 Tax=Williamsia marianensis TaxID=85044 RepID=A0ABU4ENI9_WILMA|nr:NAD(P)H-binding protein [Williamsia muralis]MDV7132820.1 NAD(P)H-binding protein [Williamsia muralis]